MAARSTVDLLHDAVALGPACSGRGPGPADEQPETGPVPSETAAARHVLPATWPARVARHPGVLAVLVTLVVA